MHVCRGVCEPVCVRVRPFVNVCHVGVVLMGLSAGAGPALHLLSLEGLIHSAPPLFLHALYLSPALTCGGGKGLLMRPEGWAAEGINEGLPGHVHVCTTAASIWSRLFYLVKMMDERVSPNPVDRPLVVSYSKGSCQDRAMLLWLLVSSASTPQTADTSTRLPEGSEWNTTHSRTLGPCRPSLPFTHGRRSVTLKTPSFRSKPAFLGCFWASGRVQATPPSPLARRDEGSVHFHYEYFRFYSQKWQKNHRFGLFQATVYVITHCPFARFPLVHVS